MISDSAWDARLQLCPALSSACDIVANPSPSARSASESVTPGAVPVWWSAPHEAPWWISSLWLNCGCGATPPQGLPGWNSTAIWYWSRSR